MNQSNQYYTAREAQEKLGLSKAKFHKMVRQGLIPKVVLPGMKQGIYPKRDIDALSLSMAAHMDEIEFSRSSPADLVEEMRIGVKYFGRSFLTPLPEQIALQQKSEFSFHSLKVYGRVVGSLSMFRLPAPLLDELLTSRRTLWEITAKEVLPFVRLEPFPLYIGMLIIDPDLSLHLQRLYAGVMIVHFIDLLATMLANDYQVNQLFTLATTKECVRLMQKLGFRPLEGKSLVPDRVAYEYLLDAKGALRLQELQHFYRSRLHAFF